MKICDYCNASVEYLVDTRIHMSVSNGEWKYIIAELCPRCERKLVEAEREHREIAILKAHSPYAEKIKRDEC